MASSDSTADGLITPLDPGTRQGVARVTDGAATRQQSTHTTAFCRIEAAVASSPGNPQGRNEDAHSALGGSGRLFVVADGVGGGAMAQLASRLLVARLHEVLEPQRRIDASRLREAMLDADRLVAQQLARVTDAPGAATVALCAPANLAASKWLIAWVGDCRVYRLAQGRAPHMELLTRDDTFRHLNEAPPRGGLADDPARMVGNGAITGANTALHGLACGDLLMLCSDGVHKHSGADEWCRVLTRPLPLYQQCDAVLALARFNGSTDDATVMLVRRRTVSHARWFALDRSGSRGATR